MVFLATHMVLQHMTLTVHAHLLHLIFAQNKVKNLGLAHTLASLIFIRSQTCSPLPKKEGCHIKHHRAKEGQQRFVICENDDLASTDIFGSAELQTPLPGPLCLIVSWWV